MDANVAVREQSPSMFAVVVTGNAELHLPVDDAVFVGAGSAQPRDQESVITRQSTPRLLSLAETMDVWAFGPMDLASARAEGGFPRGLETREKQWQAALSLLTGPIRSAMPAP